MSKLTQVLAGRALLWISLLYLVLPLLAFPEIIFGRQTLYWTDLSWIHYPRHLFAASEWLAGRAPLWDPYEDTGVPLLAESQVGALYPLSLLFLSPLSPSLELSLFILVHFTLAAFFTYGLARTLALSRPAAGLAGLSFGFGGFLMAQVPNLNIMTGAAWLPLLLLAAIQVARQRRLLAAMLAGLPLALQILTSQPQIVFYSLVVLAAFAVYRLVVDFRLGHGRRAAQTGLLLLVMVTGGLLLAAPQLLPTLELQQMSVRSQERELKFLTENSLPPAMWLNLLLPGAFGNNVTGFKGGDPFQEVFVYAGFIPLWLAVAGLPGLRRAPDNNRLFFLFLLAGAALLAMGSYTPLYELVIQYLPGFALFRIPSRWLVGVNLALAVLAGIGLDRLLARGVSRRHMLLLVVFGFLLAAGLWGFGRYGAGWLERSGGRLDESYQRLALTFLERGFQIHPLYRERLLLRWLAGLTAPAFLLATNLVVLAGLLALHHFRRLGPGVLAGLLLAATAVDLVVAGGVTINPLKPAAWWQELSGGARYVIERLDGSRVFPLGMGSEEAAVSHLGHYFPSIYGVRSAGGHGSSLRSARYDTFVHEADPVQAIRVLGVRYLLTLGQMGADVAATYPLVYSDQDSYVYENRQPLPRAFVVHQALRASSPDEALAHFQERRIDPGQAVVIESEAGLPLPASPAAGVASTATIVAEQPQAIEIEVELAADGYLVLLDSFYPGWSATVDGRPAGIYPANYIGRAVFVPAGRHLVRFEYRPGSFQLGLGLAALALALIAVAALVPYRFITHSSSINSSSSSSQSSSNSSSSSHSSSSNSSRSSRSSSSRLRSVRSSGSSTTASTSANGIRLGSSNSSSSRKSFSLR